MPFLGRSPDEAHRPATPLELFFDLVFVVAIAQAAAGLHHGIAENHIQEAVVNYAVVFFAIWWAWMAFTWFASSYDNDDVPYRLAVFLQLTGAIVLASGVGRVFADRDFSVVLAGYVIMRIASIAQHLRAAHHNPDERPAERRLATSLVVSQLLWIALILYMPHEWVIPGAIVLGIQEMWSYAWANSKRAKRTWHRDHISERYGLLTIIVLGETLLAASMALESIFDAGEFVVGLLPLLLGGLLTVFAMWWMYFDEDASHLLEDTKTAYQWGYGHYVIFASAAAVGAGLAIALDFATHHAEISATVAGLALAIPTALFLLATWYLQERPSDSNDGIHMPFAAFLILVAPWTAQPALTIGLVMTAAVALKVVLRHRAGASTSSS